MNDKTRVAFFKVSRVLILNMPHKKFNRIAYIRLVIKIKHWLEKLRYNVFSPLRFIYLLALIIGLISGVYALLIVKMTVFVNDVLMHGLFRKYDYYYFLFPGLGLLFTYLFIRFVIKQPVIQGIPATLRAITNHGIFKEKYQTYSSLILVPFTVGLGGSGGLEGPTVVSGAALTTKIAEYFKMDRKTRVLLIGCAAVGAMSSLFKAPMAAIVFAIEVFALDFTLGSMIPLLLSSISAITISYFFNDNDVIFPVRIIGEFQVSAIPYYVLLGVFSGFASVSFTRMYKFTERYFKRNSSPFLKIILGGLTIGVITFFFPPIFGEGAEKMNEMLRGNGDILMMNTYFQQFYNPITIVIFILSVGALKTIATATTLGAGGVAGIFGPSLFAGCTLGNGFAKFLNLFGFNVSEVNFSLVGMSGLLAGVLHAPLTAIFLIAEISNGYTLIVPIMLVVVIAFGINRYYFKLPFYKEELAHRGELTTHDKDSNILIDMNMDEITETNVHKLKKSDYLGALVRLVEMSKRNVFPVINENDEFIGVVNVNEHRKTLFEVQQYGTLPIMDLTTAPPAIIIKGKDNPKTILQKFEETGSWVLPVLNGKEFVGFISKSKLLNLYRKKLKELDYTNI